MVLLVAYGIYWHSNLSENKIFITSDTNHNVRNQFSDKSFLLEHSFNLGKSSTDSPHHSEQSSLNIYFTVKTTPGNYEKRIHPLQISWFQKVNKEMVSSYVVASMSLNRICTFILNVTRSHVMSWFLQTVVKLLILEQLCILIDIAAISPKFAVLSGFSGLQWYVY